MVKIDIISGFLGAGKTTLINKLIRESFEGEKIVLIENEFGDIGIDGGFLKDSGINITEMNSGCICCSLVGDFSEALKKVVAEYSPERVIIEPSGVGKLSDVIKAVKNAEIADSVLNSHTVVVDAAKCKMYMKNFGEFFGDQIEHASCIVFSHTDTASEKKTAEAIELVREHNSTAFMVTTPISALTGAALLDAIERRSSIEDELHEMLEHEHHHHHDHECHDEHCDCHEHEHHHHHDHECHDEHCDCHEHEHHHHHDHECHDEHCDCHEHEHHHHHHHADEVFTSWGKETVKKFTKDGLMAILEELENESKYGYVLRAKGIVECECGKWLHFDYVPGEPDVRVGSAGVIGKLCVIGSKINEAELASLFGINN